MTTVSYIIAFLAITFLIVLFIVRILEPAYVLIFNKPLYLHWYPIPKKLHSSQKLILQREFSFYRKLSDKRKSYFEHRVKSFLQNYQFIGKEIAVTDEMKLVVAGTFVMLTFGMRNYLVELFQKVIIYPSSYYSTVTEDNHKGEYNPRMKAVVFSWEDFLLGHQITNNNINLGLHEFTHVLHFHALKSNDPSASIFFDEFNEIAKYYQDETLNKTLTEKGYFREYAYENQFEFLSVILEHFFETPHVFKKEFPELFERVKAMINFQDNYLN